MAFKNELDQTGGDGATLIQSAGPLSYTQINNYNTSISNSVNYAKLVEEYKKETQSLDSNINAIIAKIKHFSMSVDTEFIGLEQKLKNGGFDSDLTFACLLKEQYAMYLASNNLSKATQKIHAFLLARIYVAFNLYIPEAIDSGKTKTEIKELVIEKIVQPIEDVLGVDNVLDLYQDDVMAMVYFLTGNCHLKWEGNVNLSSSI